MKASKIVLVMLVALTLTCGAAFAQGAKKGIGAYDKIFEFLKEDLEKEHGRGKVDDDMVIASMASSTVLYMDLRDWAKGDWAKRDWAKRKMALLQEIDRGEVPHWKLSWKLREIKEAIDEAYEDSEDITLKWTAWLIWQGPGLMHRISSKAGTPISVQQLKLSGLIVNPDGLMWQTAKANIKKTIPEQKMSGMGIKSGKSGVGGEGGSGKGGMHPTTDSTPGMGGGGGKTGDCVSTTVKSGPVTDPLAPVAATGSPGGDGRGGTTTMSDFTELRCDELPTMNTVEMGGGISKGGKAGEALAKVAEASYWHGYHDKAASINNEKAQKASEKGTKKGKAEALYAKAEAEYQEAQAEEAEKEQDAAIAEAAKAGATDEQIEDTVDAGYSGGELKANEDAGVPAGGADYDPEASGDPCEEIINALGGDCSDSGCGDQIAGTMKDVLAGGSMNTGIGKGDPGSPDVAGSGGGLVVGDCGGGGGSFGMKPNPQIFITDPPKEGGGIEGGKKDPCKKEKTIPGKKKCCKENPDSASCKGGGGPDPAPQMMKGKMDKQDQVKDPGKMKMKGGEAGIKTDTKMKGPGGAAGKGKK